MGTRCRVCKRKLTNPKSQKRGVGPKCYKKFLRGYRGVQVKQHESTAKLEKKLNAKGDNNAKQRN